MSQITYDHSNQRHVEPKGPTAAEQEAARLQHDRDLEEQAKRLEQELDHARHTKELEDKVKHLKEEIDKVEHPPAPLPWPLNHLHGQADDGSGTEVAVVVAHPAGEDAGHVVDAAQPDHGADASHASEVAHHEVVVDHEVVG